MRIKISIIAIATFGGILLGLFVLEELHYKNIKDKIAIVFICAVLMNFIAFFNTSKVIPKIIKIMTAKSGKLVQHSSGKKGIVYNGEKCHNDKIPVYIIDPVTMNKTGQKILANPENLKIIGYIN